jgi:hypothetical protein
MPDTDQWLGLSFLLRLDGLCCAAAALVEYLARSEKRQELTYSGRISSAAPVFAVEHKWPCDRDCEGVGLARGRRRSTPKLEAALAAACRARTTTPAWSRAAFTLDGRVGHNQPVSGIDAL